MPRYQWYWMDAPLAHSQECIPTYDAIEGSIGLATCHKGEDHTNAAMTDIWNAIDASNVEEINRACARYEVPLTLKRIE